MPNILDNAINVLKKRFPTATVPHKEYTSSEQDSGTFKSSVINMIIDSIKC
jgi:hypothetical protein